VVKVRQKKTASKTGHGAPSGKGARLFCPPSGKGSGKNPALPIVARLAAGRFAPFFGVGGAGGAARALARYPSASTTH